MGLDFSKAKTVEAEAVTSDVAENEALPTVQTFDIAVESAKIKNELADSAEVDALVSKIELDNLDSIVTFGGEVATEISKSSDLVLNSMNIAQIEETSKMLGVLTNIMSKFDIEEIKQEPGLFDKLFGGIKKQLDKIMTKYQTMGGEIDKVYVELKGYEGEIKETNKKLNTMFESNVNYYHDLLKLLQGILPVYNCLSGTHLPFSHLYLLSHRYHTQYRKALQHVQLRRVHHAHLLHALIYL